MQVQWGWYQKEVNQISNRHSGVRCLDRHQSHYEGSYSTQKLYEGLMRAVMRDGCQGLCCIRSYLLSQGHIVQAEFMSFSQFCLSSVISLGPHLGMFDHTWHSGCSSA